MTQGEAAYREDVRRQPTYPWSNEPRRSWDALEPEIKANWEKYPTPRDWGTKGNDAAVFDALVAALESIVELERIGGLPLAMSMTAQSALDLAKGN